jgi:hypothetical protein
LAIIEQERAVEVSSPAVTTSDILHRAADLLEEFGWCQGVEAKDQDGFSCNPFRGSVAQLCMGGAVRRARFEFGGVSELDNPYDWHEAIDPNWNDQPGRTKAEVVARLRHAAEAA